MTGRLEAAARQQRELDGLRRDLVAWIGHDLRTPLASLRVIVEAVGPDTLLAASALERTTRTTPTSGKRILSTRASAGLWNR